MNALITGDLHLSPEPLDEYRWRIFPWLEQAAKQYQADAVFILGDLTATNRKDNHGSKLVNGIVDSIASLAEVAEVYILMGNHDYVDPLQPYFHFLNHVGRGVTYVREPAKYVIGGERCAFLPHRKGGWNKYDWEKQLLVGGSYSLCLLHQTVFGAHLGYGVLSETTERLEVPSARRIISGDIHIPQDAGKVRYVGAPYHVTFGDDYTPRVLLHTADGAQANLTPPRFVRATINSANVKQLEGELRAKRPDQAKVHWWLKPADVKDFPRVRKEIIALFESKQITLAGLDLTVDRTDEQQLIVPDVLTNDPTEILKRYCHARGLLDEVVQAGLDLLLK